MHRFFSASRWLFGMALAACSLDAKVLTLPGIGHDMAVDGARGSVDQHLEQ
jgi:hypothetical protein